MAESETTVSGTCTAMEYNGSVDTGPNIVADSGVFATGCCLVDGRTYGEEVHVDTVFENKPVTGIEKNVAVADNTPAVPAPAAGYNPLNGSVSVETGSMVIENVNAGNTLDGAASEKQFVDGSALSTEEERLWSIVKANSLDFDTWTALIEETEKVAGDKILRIRKIYDAFLAEFPLCYGYWKKYADHEARLGSVDKVVEVYERAVHGVTYSVDIWLHYCIFAISTYGDPDTIRRLFERGLAYVGTDYFSSPLWDRYIEYEGMHSEWNRVASIYTRILEFPNKRLDDYLIRFKAFAANRPLSELRSSDEAAASATGSHVNGGEVHDDTSEQSSKPTSAGLAEADELEKYIGIREELYKKAKEFDSKICDFENAIRRPYFHVRPLNVTELENWHSYLDFIERQDDLNKVVKLYERCLIACANYPEYWIRYALCMEAWGSTDLADNALARATHVFVKRQPKIHLFAARFKEQRGDIPGARAAYQCVHAEIAPGLIEAIIKHANMEHRLGNLEDAFSLYEQAIAIEKGKEHSHALAMLYAQYARFLYLVSGNAERARNLLVEALDNVQLSKPFLEAIIHFESIQSLPKRIDYLDSLVEKFIEPNVDNLNAANAAEREELSCIYLEFLGYFGDVQSIKKAEDRHARLFLPHRSQSELKKRHADDYLSSDKAKLAKSYSDAPSQAESLMCAYPNSQNQWAASYGVQPPTWPPATQTQVQQWAPGFGQQAAYTAYTAYSGYGSSYTSPQVSTSASQTAVYGAYPPTYPAQQAFPQQSYAQPTVTTTLAPSQQPASVPQPYYGNYY
ncbi:hypothetical protein K2173_018444 [Erythroxylum novogranatense]|uniref:Pre-mRNA-processing factor 39 n=1 Tax=Erythroxylum novogranatense TaxID=1862640 RepID=A0AAV8UAA1_9ROSI|nr:hypothetical protein K2173_018444 [Erythroxylum novogranatense]